MARVVLSVEVIPSDDVVVGIAVVWETAIVDGKLVARVSIAGSIRITTIQYVRQKSFGSSNWFFFMTLSVHDMTPQVVVDF